jgi:hypothetical protein
LEGKYLSRRAPATIQGAVKYIVVANIRNINLEGKYLLRRAPKPSLAL